MYFLQWVLVLMWGLLWWISGARPTKPNARIAASAVYYLEEHGAGPEAAQMHQDLVWIHGVDEDEAATFASLAAAKLKPKKKKDWTTYKLKMKMKAATAKELKKKAVTESQMYQTWVHKLLHTSGFLKGVDPKFGICTRRSRWTVQLKALLQRVWRRMCMQVQQPLAVDNPVELECWSHANGIQNVRRICIFRRHWNWLAMHVCLLQIHLYRMYAFLMQILNHLLVHPLLHPLLQHLLERLHHLLHQVLLDLQILQNLLLTMENLDSRKGWKI